MYRSGLNGIGAKPRWTSAVAALVTAIVMMGALLAGSQAAALMTNERIAAVATAPAQSVDPAPAANRNDRQAAVDLKKTICETIIIYFTTQVCQTIDTIDKITGKVKQVYQCVMKKIPKEKQVCKEVTVPTPPDPHFPKPGVQQ